MKTLVLAAFVALSSAAHAQIMPVTNPGVATVAQDNPRWIQELKDQYPPAKTALQSMAPPIGLADVRNATSCGDQMQNMALIGLQTNQVLLQVLLAVIEGNPLVQQGKQP